MPNMNQGFYSASPSASSSYGLIERNALSHPSRPMDEPPHDHDISTFRSLYPDGTMIDWQREEAAERERKRLLYAQRGLRGVSAPILDSSRMWLVIVLTGVGIGTAGAWFDVLVRWCVAWCYYHTYVMITDCGRHHWT